MNNTIEHQKLVHEIHLAVGSLQGVRLFARNVGVAVPWSSLKAALARGPITRLPAPLTYGVDGEADLQGFMRYQIKDGGMIAAAMAIEVKTGTGRLQKNQVKWRDMFQLHGGIYIEARNVEDTLQAVKMLLACQLRG